MLNPYRLKKILQGSSQEFKDAAKGLLLKQNKVPLLKPDKKAMKAEFMAGFDEWKKTHPDGTEWQYAKDFMLGKIK